MIVIGVAVVVFVFLIEVIVVVLGVVIVVSSLLFNSKTLSCCSIYMLLPLSFSFSILFFICIFTDGSFCALVFR